MDNKTIMNERATIFFRKFDHFEVILRLDLTNGYVCRNKKIKNKIITT